MVYLTQVSGTRSASFMVNKLVMTALRLAATRKLSAVKESILLDATTEALL